MKNVILGKLNGSNTNILYWKLGDIECEIGDYAIVENSGGYDLAKIIGKAIVDDSFKYGNKKVKCIISKNDVEAK